MTLAFFRGPGDSAALKADQSAEAKPLQSFVNAPVPRNNVTIRLFRTFAQPKKLRKFDSDQKMNGILALQMTAVVSMFAVK